MSEKTFKYIKIGGTLAVERVFDLLQNISADGVRIASVTPTTSIQHKLAVIDDNIRGDWLWLETVSDDTAFEHTERFCIQHDLEFDRHTVSEWGYSGTVYQHRVGTSDCVTLTASVTAETIAPEDEEQVRELLDSGDAGEAMKIYDNAVNKVVTALSPFTIV